MQHKVALQNTADMTDPSSLGKLHIYKEAQFNVYSPSFSDITFADITTCFISFIIKYIILLLLIIYRLRSSMLETHAIF